MGIGNNAYKRKYLILEAHLDDFEIGMSAWLQKAASYPSEITLVTFCRGRGQDVEDANRLYYRNKNLENFRNWNPNIQINNIHLDFIDTRLDACSMGTIINKLYASMGKNFDIGEYKEIYFHQQDLHDDHNIVNKIGKILTRQYKGKVFEFVITNSGYMSEFTKYNTEIKVEYKFKDERYSEMFIYPCLFPTEKTSLQQVLYGQKAFDGKFISDKFNLIKDIFVAN